MDACLDLYKSGLDIKIRCSGYFSLNENNLNIYEPIIDILGWLNYKDFIIQMSDCDGYLLFQDCSKRNIARFPNKFGDYLGMQGYILSNCIGDLSQYLNIKGSPLVNLGSNDKVKQWIKKMFLKEVQFKPDKNFIAKNTWDERSRQLSSFLSKCQSTHNEGVI